MDPATQQTLIYLAWALGGIIVHHFVPVLGPLLDFIGSFIKKPTPPPSPAGSVSLIDLVEGLITHPEPNVKAAAPEVLRIGRVLQKAA